MKAGRKKAVAQSSAGSIGEMKRRSFYRGREVGRRGSQARDQHRLSRHAAIRVITCCRASTSRMHTSRVLSLPVLARQDLWRVRHSRLASVSAQARITKLASRRARVARARHAVWRCVVRRTVPARRRVHAKTAVTSYRRAGSNGGRDHGRAQPEICHVACPQWKLTR